MIARLFPSANLKGAIGASFFPSADEASDASRLTWLIQASDAAAGIMSADGNASG